MERWARLKLSGEPKDIDENAWWYEEPDGIDVHVEPSETHRSFKIPAAALRRYLKRLDRGLAVEREAREEKP